MSKAKLFRLSLLGPARVERAGAIVRGFESRKALALLCYLAALGRSVTRRQLAGLFWPGKPQARGRGNLSRVLNNLSNLLPDSIEADRHRLALKLENVRLDTTLFERLETSHDPRTLADGAELCRGPFLAGLELTGCPHFETWIAGARERWRRRIAHLLRRMSTYHETRHENESVIRYASKLLELEPWHEDGHRALMLALARSGKRRAALEQYAACSRALDSMLGVEPSRETTDLYKCILNSSRKRLGRFSATDPALPGNEISMGEIGARLTNTSCRLLTLLGPAGTGKTQLALRTVREESHAFLDGAVFVPLERVDSERRMLLEVARSLRFHSYMPESRRRKLVGHLARKDILIALDGFERLTEVGSRFLVELLAAAPGTKILVTSRRRLNLHSEWILEVSRAQRP